jgi:toxin ParE1/3/4
MKKYDVRWADAAETDLTGIVEYGATDSPSNASEILENVRKKASSLQLFPERGRVVPELRDQGVLQYRELMVGPWRTIYRISEKRVYVLSALDLRRNVEDLLLERLIRSKW